MTLYETLIALAIMAIVFTTSVVKLTPSLETGKVRATQMELKSLRAGSVLFHLQVGRLPNDIEELCRVRPRLMNDCDEVDPFGNDYRYRDGIIYSAGIDARYNTRDDIILEI